jgi:ZIP family zinc transporter
MGRPSKTEHAMEILRSGSGTSPWRAVWARHAAKHPVTAAGFAAALVAVLFLLVTSLVELVQGRAEAALALALAGGAAGLVATAVGAAPALVLRRLSQRTEDVMLGLAAGMMLAASSFSLILPGLAAGEAVTGNAALGALTVVVGLGLGVVLMLGLDQFMPHEHAHLGVHGAGGERLSRIWLFVFAITLHNLPEGMAIGVSFSQGDMSVGLPLTSAIAIQDMPEGLAVAMALVAAGMSRAKAAALAAASGLMEPLGALLGAGLTSGLAISYPVGLGLAAGAMIFVVSHEVIPETHRNGHQTPATVGLIAGFAVMMFLDTALG